MRERLQDVVTGRVSKTTQLEERLKVSTTQSTYKLPVLHQSTAAPAVGKLQRDCVPNIADTCLIFC